MSFTALAEENFRPEDFAGAMVYTGKEGSLLKLELNEEVYQGLMRPDLGDIRIFDASGNPVPFIVRDKPKEIFTPPPEEVPFFLWNGGKENNLPANTDIEINTSGGVVRIKNQNSAPENQSVYLVDLSFLEYSPSELRVVSETQQNFNTSVTIHYSGDLSEWRAFEKRQVLAYFGGRAQDRLELPENSFSRYLLLSFAREAPPPLGMTVYFKQQEKPAEYREVIVKGQKSRDGKKINYETGAFYPAESVDFILEEADSIPVLIKNRLSEDEEWNIITKGTLYRYNSASGIVKNPPFEIAHRGLTSRALFWELESTGDLPFTTTPDMTIRWTLKEIIFPARGMGPWTLVYGNPDCAPLSSAGLLPSGIGEELEPAIFTGEKRFEKSSPVVQKEKNYRIYFLWAFLGAASLALTILAVSIAKSMRK